jgi:hypothetical protein
MALSQTILSIKIRFRSLVRPTDFYKPLGVRFYQGFLPCSLVLQTHLHFPQENDIVISNML